jgi:hypothetical protein
MAIVSQVWGQQSEATIAAQTATTAIATARTTIIIDDVAFSCGMS